MFSFLTQSRQDAKIQGFFFATLRPCVKNLDETNSAKAQFVPTFSIQCKNKDGYERNFKQAVVNEAM